MNKTNLIIGAILVILAIGLLWSVGRGQDKVSNNTPEETVSVAEKFISPETGESVQVVFTEKSAVLENAKFDAVELTQVEAASGARYENTKTGTTLWNKGSQITVYQNDEVVFTGESEDSLETKTEVVPNVATSSSLLNQSWVWKETRMNDGAIISPKQAGSFVLTFNEEGRVNGQTDCNGFGGGYTLTDGVLAMGPFMMTMMYCEGSQEMEFQKMLSEPVTFMFTEGGELVLMLPLDSGSVILEPKI